VARKDGREVVIGAAKQRALLAVLLLHANQTVSTDRLIDALWGERPPERAGKALQVYVSQLRKALDRSLLVTRAPGYALELPPDTLDTQRFEQLSDEGRDLLARGEAATAAASLRDALALWRGPPLADLSFEAFAQGPIAELEEKRVAALEDRIDADLALGRHSTLVGEIEALVAEHPLRERLRGQLMLALFRSGRQGDALSAFQDARRTLVDELGVEPGRALRELHQAILRQDPALELPLETAEPPSAEPPPEPAAETRKRVTVLSVGLGARSSHGAPLDPEVARTLLRRALAHVREAVERHGGTVQAVAGEAVTAVFGIPVVHEDDALRAMRAASELADLLGTLVTEAEASGARLEYRTGLSTGEVVTGGDAEAPVGEPLIDAVQLAYKGATGDILLDEPTYRLVRDAVVVDSAGEARRLTRLADRVAPRRLASPMVGRGRERRRLGDAFEQALADRTCQLFTIIGEAGVGKSRLVQEFVDDLAGRATVVRGRCLPYGEGITYWPLREAIRDAARLEEADSPEKSRDKLAAVVDDEDADAVAWNVAGLIGLAEADTAAEEGFAAVRVLFEALARRRPLVLVFDDIHWAQATFLDLVEHVADWSRGVPLLVVCVARPELLEIRPGWGGGKLNATAVLLEPLSAAESAELVDNLAGADVASETRERVVAAAEGNPLFVEEMLALAREDVTADTLAVPPTIQALLAARLDRLEAAERAVLERASVEGKVFHEGAVEALSPPGAAVAGALAALLRKELVRPDRPLFTGVRAFRFRHLLIRDAAYDSIPKQARAELHERYADWLEQKAAGHAAEYDEIVGYHLEQAFRYQAELSAADERAHLVAGRAAAALGAAGRRAFARRDVPAGVNLISRAAALLPADDPARLELVPNVRVAQGLGDDLAWADAVVGDALETGDERLRAHALVQRGFLRLFTEPESSPDELVGAAESARNVFARHGDDLGLARAWRLEAQARYLARTSDAAREAFEHALEHARRAGEPFEVREIVEWLAVTLALGPTSAADASRRCEELLAMAADDSFLQVTLLAVRGHLERLLGRPEVAEPLFARAREIAGDERSLRRVAYYSIYVSLLRTYSDEAERELRAGIEGLSEVGEKTNFCTLAAQLGRVLCDQGRYEEAEESTRVAEEAARPNDVMANIMWRAARARARAAQGDLTTAETLADEAVAFAAASDFINEHADALMDEAEVLRAAGRPDAAREAIADALVLYEQKGNVVSAAAARAALDSRPR
jgi:DNA-binding SARP family transcriptional activator/tetratricopeptide (TPR) repeat protein